MVYDSYFKGYIERFRETDRGMWNYEDGCVLIGLQALYRATGERVCFDTIKQFMERFIEPDGTIRNYNLEDYNIDSVPAGLVLFDLYHETGEMRYRKAIETLEKQLINQPRTQSGSFWHKKIYPYQVWLDGLYMGLPYYTAYERSYGDGSRYEDVLTQFRNARKTLYDTEKHLYYHAWNETRDIFWADRKTGRSANFWTRSIGWFLMALADVYDLLPKSRAAQRAELAALWREAIDGVLEYRDPDSGLFYQVTDMPDVEGNYLETSGSLMVAYSLLKGARLGVLSGESYMRAGEDILFGIAVRKFEFHGGRLMLGGICKGAGLGPDGNYRRDGSVAYYLSEDVVYDEQKGFGVCMMAYAEYLRLRAAGRLAPACPEVGIFNKGYDPIMPDEIAALDEAKLAAGQAV